MTVKERVKSAEKRINTKKNRQNASYAAFFALGFLLSIGSVFGGLHPFGVSLTAVSKKRYFVFAAAGAAAGCIVNGLDAYSARYICAVTVAAIGALASAAFEFGISPVFSTGLSFVSIFLTGLALNVRLEAPAGAYVLTLGEALLSAGAAFFFYRALNSNYRRMRFRALPQSDVICIAVCASVMIMNLSSLNMFLFSPALAAAAFTVLCALGFFSDRMGVTLALSFGFAAGISSRDTLFTVGALAFSAMVASLFTPLNRFASSAAFLVTNAFFSIASESDSAVMYFISCAAGAAVYAFLPSSAVSRLEKLGESGRNPSPEGALRQSLVLKLRFASSAMAAISESVDQVREKINEITRKNNELHKNEISENEYVQREIILEKTNRIRMVASDQFYSISGMLEDLAFEFDEAEIFDSAASSKIRRVLGEHDIFPLNISAIEDRFGRMRVEILLDSVNDYLKSPKLASEIGKACSRYFDRGQITNFRNETMLSFSERPTYKLNTGFAQRAAEGKLCGDTVKLLNDGRGHSVLIISDGMGKGSRAALDGAMGAGLLSKLINAGFGFDSALRVVNSALLIKSNDESLATLDIASIDLFTGKCDFYKAGAPASFIIHKNSITPCELTSMPAGILRGIEFARRTAVLKPDDLVMLMSDGICSIGEEKLNVLLHSAAGLEPQEAAELLLNGAAELSDEKTADDMSVIAARLERNI